MKTDSSLKKYIKAVSRRLNLPAHMKKRMLSDMETTVNARIEQGETLGDVLASFGSPVKVAEEFNTEMQEYTYRKSPLRFLFLIPAVLGGVWLITRVLNPIIFALSVPSSSVGIIGGADGPTSIYITAQSFNPWWYLLPALLLIAIGVAGFILLGRLKNRKK